MRKMLAVVLVLTCLLGVAGCSSMKVDKTKPVFETDNISSISFYTMPNHNDEFKFLLNISKKSKHGFLRLDSMRK